MEYGSHADLRGDSRRYQNPPPCGRPLYQGVGAKRRGIWGHNHALRWRALRACLMPSPANSITSASIAHSDSVGTEVAPPATPPSVMAKVAVLPGQGSGPHQAAAFHGALKRLDLHH